MNQKRLRIALAFLMLAGSVYAEEASKVGEDKGWWYCEGYLRSEDVSLVSTAFYADSGIGGATAKSLREEFNKDMKTDRAVCEGPYGRRKAEDDRDFVLDLQRRQGFRVRSVRWTGSASAAGKRPTNEASKEAEPSKGRPANASVTIEGPSGAQTAAEQAAKDRREQAERSRREQEEKAFAARTEWAQARMNESVKSQMDQAFKEAGISPPAAQAGGACKWVPRRQAAFRSADNESEARAYLAGRSFSGACLGGGNATLEAVKCSQNTGFRPIDSKGKTDWSTPGKVRHDCQAIYVCERGALDCGPSKPSGASRQ